MSGVESIEMTFVTKNVHVKHDAQRTSPAVLLAALNGAGLQASLGKREANEGKNNLSVCFKCQEPNSMMYTLLWSG